ncbi:hypothetical protein ACA351_05790 [Orientia tsutsugamushi]|uniref:hypothetical protein n=1 Tax=Orientia tsutsugamushi TaxID=784 RepID=UPI0035293CD5
METKMNTGMKTKLMKLVEVINQKPWLKYSLFFVLMSVATYVNYKLVSKDRPELFDSKLAKQKLEESLQNQKSSKST